MGFFRRTHSKTYRTTLSDNKPRSICASQKTSHCPTDDGGRVSCRSIGAIPLFIQKSYRVKPPLRLMITHNSDKTAQNYTIKYCAAIYRLILTEFSEIRVPVPWINCE